MKEVSRDLDDYIKVVVDVRRELLTAGGTRHVQGEELLLADGSNQSDLWGGALDLETGEIVLNIAVNLSRIGRYSQEGKQERVNQFIKETRDYFEPTRKKFAAWLGQAGDKIDPKEAYTWANILTHRVKLIS